jgi:molybdopterin-guanine dinucleotide biosynthesis protein A
MSLPILYGLVLAGGKSLRMGYDKTTIVYHTKPQCEYVVDLLQQFCSQVFVSCKTRKNIPANFNILPDQLSIESPLNGILSAFRHTSSAAWISVPVDMPGINSEAIHYLIRHRNPEKVATCFYDSEGKNPEPLFTIWEPKAYLLLEKFYMEGNKSVRKFLMDHSIELLKPPSSQINININTVDELRKYTKKNNLPS